MKIAERIKEFLIDSGLASEQAAEIVKIYQLQYESDLKRIKELEIVIREFLLIDQDAYDSSNLRFEFKVQQGKFKQLLETNL